MERLNSEAGRDPLTDMLSEVRFRSTIFCRSDLGAPWGFSVSAREIATFHFVERGQCWLEVEDSSAPLLVRPGELVILPHGHAHALRDAPGSKLERLDDLVAAATGTAASVSGTLRFGGDGPKTTLVCGGFILERRDALPFLPALPAVLHIGAGASRVGSWLQMAQDIIADALANDRLAESTLINRIADLIFIEAVRLHFSDASGSARGWFAALQDRNVGRAISLIHREPERDWTVGTLASAVGMSRTAFAVRFSMLLGQSPIRYLASRRIAHAGTLLEHDTWTVSRIAEAVGYDSEAAFSRAFKRHVGLSPGEYRKSLADQRSRSTATAP